MPDSQNLSPAEIVAQLDRTAGQADAKRAVAVALRNRWRRQQLPPELRQEDSPKNILMIGPTGVGKTEIARRLARLAQAPFIKVEATKFTEVGYVGRDVDYIIRDLVEIGITMVREKRRERSRPRRISMPKNVLSMRWSVKAHRPTRETFRRSFAATSSTIRKSKSKSIRRRVAALARLIFLACQAATSLTSMI